MKHPHLPGHSYPSLSPSPWTSFLILILSSPHSSAHSSIVIITLSSLASFTNQQLLHLVFFCVCACVCVYVNVFVCHIPLLNFSRPSSLPLTLAVYPFFRFPYNYFHFLHHSICLPKTSWTPYPHKPYFSLLLTLFYTFTKFSRSISLRLFTSIYLSISIHIYLSFSTSIYLSIYLFCNIRLHLPLSAEHFSPKGLKWHWTLRSGHL